MASGRAGSGLGSSSLASSSASSLRKSVMDSEVFHFILKEKNTMLEELQGDNREYARLTESLGEEIFNLRTSLSEKSRNTEKLEKQLEEAKLRLSIFEAQSEDRGRQLLVSEEREKRLTELVTGYESTLTECNNSLELVSNKATEYEELYTSLQRKCGDYDALKSDFDRIRDSLASCPAAVRAASASSSSSSSSSSASDNDSINKDPHMMSRDELLGCLEALIALGARFSEMEQTLNETTSYAQSLQLDKAELEVQLSSAQNAASQARIEAKQATSQLGDVRKALEGAQEARQLGEGMSMHLGGEISILREQLEAAQSKLQTLNDTLAETSAQLSTAEEKLDMQTREAEELLNLKQLYEKHADTLRAEVDALQNELGTRKGDEQMYSKLSDDLHAALLQISALEEDKSELLKSLSDGLVKRNELERRIIDVSVDHGKQLQKLQDEWDRKEREFKAELSQTKSQLVSQDDYKSALLERDSLLQSANRLTVMTDALQTELEDATSSKRKLDLFCRLLRSIVFKTRDQKKALEKKVEALKDDLNERDLKLKHDDYPALVLRAEKLASEVSALETVLSQERRKVSSLLKERDDVRSMLSEERQIRVNEAASLEDKIKSFEGIVTELKRKFEETQSKLTASLQEAIALRDIIAKLEAEKVKLEAGNQSWTTDKLQLVSEINTWKAKHSSLEQSLLEAQERHQDELEHEKQEFKRFEIDLRTEFAKTESELQFSVSELTVKCGDLERQCQELGSSLLSTTSTIDATCKELETAKQEVSSLTAQSSSLSTQLYSFQQRTASLVRDRSLLLSHLSARTSEERVLHDLFSSFQRELQTLLHVSEAHLSASIPDSSSSSVSQSQSQSHIPNDDGSLSVSAMTAVDASSSAITPEKKLQQQQQESQQQQQQPQGQVQPASSTAVPPNLFSPIGQTPLSPILPNTPHQLHHHQSMMSVVMAPMTPVDNEVSSSSSPSLTLASPPSSTSILLPDELESAMQEAVSSSNAVASAIESAIPILRKQSRRLLHAVEGLIEETDLIRLENEERAHLCKTLEDSLQQVRGVLDASTAENERLEAELGRAHIKLDQVDNAWRERSQVASQDVEKLRLESSAFAENVQELSAKLEAAVREAEECKKQASDSTATVQRLQQEKAKIADQLKQTKVLTMENIGKREALLKELEKALAENKRLQDTCSTLQSHIQSTSAAALLSSLSPSPRPVGSMPSSASSSVAPSPSHAGLNPQPR